jgi:hypothetical protein
MFDMMKVDTDKAAANNRFTAMVPAGKTNGG